MSNPKTKTSALSIGVVPDDLRAWRDRCAPAHAWAEAFAAREAASQGASLCYSTKRDRPSDLSTRRDAHPCVWSRGRVHARCDDRTQSQLQVRLLMAGSRTVGDPICELADTGSYYADPAQAPRMSLVRTGAVRSGTKDLGRIWRYETCPRPTIWDNFISTRQRSFFTGPTTTRTTSRTTSWCLGATQLNASGPAAFGPWRFSGGGRLGPWRGVQIGEHPLTGELLCGSRLLSGNSISPWGPDLWGGQFPTASTPSGYGAPDLQTQKYLTYYPMIGKVSTNGTFSGALTSCRRPGDYFFEPIVGQTSYNQVDPTKNGGVGSWTELDGVNGHT